MKKLITAAAIAASSFASPAMSAMHAVLNCDGMVAAFDVSVDDKISIQVGTHKYKNQNETEYKQNIAGDKVTLQSAKDEFGNEAGFGFTEDQLAASKVTLVRYSKASGRIKTNNCTIVGGESW